MDSLRGTAEEVERIADALARRRVGVAVGLVDLRDGQQIVAGRGVARQSGDTPITAATLFEIGSVTKTFTGLLLADAVVRGELSLDTPLQELLPEGVRAPIRDGRGVTLEHLATHRSGLGRSPLGYTAEVRAGLLTGGNPYDGFSVAGLYRALDAARLHREPGTGRPRYSNFGVAVLGQVLTDHFGFRSFDELVQVRVCAPLGLNDTVVVPSAEQLRRLAVGYGRCGRPERPWDLLGIAAAGGLRSTAGDLLTYLRAHLRPEDTSLPDALRLVQQERHAGRFLGMALCWAVIARKDCVLLLHDGATGGFTSVVGFSPHAGVGVVALANNVRSPAREAFRLLERVATTKGQAPRQSADQREDDTDRLLVFPARKVNGSYPVTAGHTAVARVRQHWTGIRFEVTDAADEILCHASKGRWGLSRTWRATAPDGGPLLSITKRGLLNPRMSVALERGGTFVVAGNSWTRDFRVTDAEGHEVTSGTAVNSRPPLRSNGYAVQQRRRTFTPNELAVVVQVWRMVQLSHEAAVVGAAGLGALVACSAACSRCWRPQQRRRGGGGRVSASQADEVARR